MFMFGYINIRETRNIFGNNYKTRGFMNFCIPIPSHKSTLLYHTLASVFKLVLGALPRPTHLGHLMQDCMQIFLSLSLEI